MCRRIATDPCGVSSLDPPPIGQVSAMDSSCSIGAEDGRQGQGKCALVPGERLPEPLPGASGHGGDPACWRWAPRRRFDARLASAVDNFANVDPRGCEAALFACEYLAHRRSLCPTARPSAGGATTCALF